MDDAEDDCTFDAPLLLLLLLLRRLTKNKSE